MSNSAERVQDVCLSVFGDRQTEAADAETQGRFLGRQRRAAAVQALGQAKLQALLTHCGSGISISDSGNFRPNKLKLLKLIQQFRATRWGWHGALNRAETEPFRKEQR